MTPQLRAVALGVHDDEFFDGPTSSEANAISPPTVEDPLRGLSALAQVATIGVERLRALASEPVIWVWKDVTVATTITMVAGAPGDGKTTLLFLLLVARLTLGEPVYLLGRRVEPAPLGKYVVLIEGEHSDPSTARKLLRSCALLGVNSDCLGRIIVLARKAVRIGSPEWLDIKRLVAAGLVSDLAIDTIARVGGGDANDEQAQTSIFDEIAQAIDSAPRLEDRPTAWVIAHTRKNGTGGIEDIAGSVQRTGQADTVLKVQAERVEGRIVASKVTFLKLREDPEEYPAPASFAIEPDESGTLRVVAAVIGDDDGRPLETRIAELLKSGPKTTRALATKLGRSWKDVNDAISNLFATKTIRSTVTDVGGRERRAFELRKDGACGPSGARDLARDSHVSGSRDEDVPC